MLVRELLPLLSGVDRLVDLTPPAHDLVTRLKVPTGMPVVPAAGDHRPGDVVLAMIGPGGAELPSPTLAALPVGARVLLLCGWTAAELPYHRLLDPLSTHRCQVIDAIPLSRGPRRGPHVALVVTRVDAVLPPRAHLISGDEPITTDTTPAGPATQVRMANEYVLGRLVERPLRRRLRALEAEVAELRARLEPPAAG